MSFHVAVLGGGISGLAAAYFVQQSQSTVPVTISVFEADDRLGGKLRQEVIAGHPVEVGAENVLLIRPEMSNFLKRLGIEAEYPLTRGAQIFSRGKLESLPPGTMFGIPQRPREAAGLLTEAEIARAEEESSPGIIPGEDFAIGAAVENALGPAVVDRMIDPLLGGIYGGQARLLSAQQTMKRVYQLLQDGTPFLAKNSDVSASPARPTKTAQSRVQAMGASAGGMGRLPGLVASALKEAGAGIHLNSPVTALSKTTTGWDVSYEQNGRSQICAADAVIMALPTSAAAAVAPTPQLVEQLSEFVASSMAILTFVFPGSASEHLPESNGFLVPAIDGLIIKAATFSSRKWPYIAEMASELTYVRASVGRYGDESTLAMGDTELLDAALNDLRKVVDLPEPIATHVQRWNGGMPQPLVGHVARVTSVMDLAGSLPGLALAGGAYRGVGVPDCLLSAENAAETITAYLDQQH